MPKVTKSKQKYKIISLHNVLRFAAVMLIPTDVLISIAIETKLDITISGGSLYYSILISFVLCIVSALFSVKRGFIPFFLELVLLTCGFIASSMFLAFLLMALDKATPFM